MLLKKTINTFGIWTQFTGYYFNDLHDILLSNGDILKSVYPNERGWTLRGSDKESLDYYFNYCQANNTLYIHDSDIVAIRLLTDGDIKTRRLVWKIGNERLERIRSVSGDGKEHVIIPRDDLIKDHQIASFVNEIREVAVKYGATQQLREHVGRRVKKLLMCLTYKR